MRNLKLVAGDSDEDPQKIVARHIKLLHGYNESKDAAQVSICSHSRLFDAKLIFTKVLLGRVGS